MWKRMRRAVSLSGERKSRVQPMARKWRSPVSSTTRDVTTAASIPWVSSCLYLFRGLSGAEDRCLLCSNRMTAGDTNALISKMKGADCGGLLLPVKKMNADISTSIPVVA